MSYIYPYPRPAATADCIAMTLCGDVLLVQRGHDPYKRCWALPGGFLEMEETTEQCAVRELKEETGLKADMLFEVGTYSQVDRDPRGRTISVAYLTIVEKPFPVEGGDDAACARWFPVHALPPLAFDHDKILKDALQKLKALRIPFHLRFAQQHGPKYNVESTLLRYDQGIKLSFVFFHSEKEEKNKVSKACLSQWYVRPFIVDDVAYFCAEQYMMAEKARLFGDKACLAKIMAAQDQGTCKALGQQVRGFSNQIWDAEKYAIIRKGNMHKFFQHPDLLRFLKRTGNSILVEASAKDRIWGIGMDTSQDGIGNPHNWRGENLLGFALMEVRDELLQDSEYGKNRDIEELREWAISFRKERMNKNSLRLSDTHAVFHWDRVYKNGLRLLDNGVDEKVVSAFAYTHDVWRDTDGCDLEHGPRAAKGLSLIRDTMLAFLSDEEYHLLCEACRLHTTTCGTDNPTLNACFDADRLDLIRIGVRPDPNRMCSPRGKELAECPTEE